MQGEVGYLCIEHLITKGPTEQRQALLQKWVRVTPGTATSWQGTLKIGRGLGTLKTVTWNGQLIGPKADQFGREHCKRESGFTHPRGYGIQAQYQMIGIFESR